MVLNFVVHRNRREFVERYDHSLAQVTTRRKVFDNVLSDGIEAIIAADDFGLFGKTIL